jgi:Ankyrin repeat
MPCPQGDNTPLHWASMRGHVEIVRLLCERSADRSIRNKQDKVGSWVSPTVRCLSALYTSDLQCKCCVLCTVLTAFLLAEPGAGGSGAALLVALVPLHAGGVGQLGTQWHRA